MAQGNEVQTGQAKSSHELAIQGTSFIMDGKPFPFTGISFFNAIFNPAFNKSTADRKAWLEKFQRYGINVLRIWGQWDNGRGYVDDCPTCTLYHPDGRLRQEHVDKLKAIITDADQLGMVIELALFAQESYYANVRLGEKEADKAVAAITRELLPYRNVVIQIWNEHSDRVLDHVKTVKSIDPKRLVTNSPGFAGVLGDEKQNQALDFLTPHTSRQYVGKHWEVAPQEIAYLLKRYRKPVVDDEPARNGTGNFGGPRDTTYPHDQIVQIYQVWQQGGYIVYHHDMFQTGYGTPAIPPSGIPDPEFSPYHRAVLEFIARRQRYMNSQ
ncbi:hypothetical protein GCM10023189_15680 [Nibrella saemangeumensis]|uniref:Glycoside hydrolase family 5 domain-containing protein n=2 Tax=Nibrella saemangeumensis TaxID=1084526 RepID=A0ABP8MKV2_9BACT